MLTYFLYILFYSVLGWIIEVVYTFQQDKQFENRGFFLGPYCPIYGVGSLLILCLFTPLTAYPVLVFLLSILVTTTLEFITGTVLEHIFHITWWDYSTEKFNYKGRICLKTALAFGLLSLTLLYLLHPFISQLVLKMSPNLKSLLAFFAASFFLLDFLVSIYSIKKLSYHIIALDMLKRNLLHIFNKQNFTDKMNRGLHSIKINHSTQHLLEKADVIFARLHNNHAKQTSEDFIKKINELKIEFKKIMHSINFIEKRIIKTFRQLESKKLEFKISELRTSFQNNQEKPKKITSKKQKKS